MEEGIGKNNAPAKAASAEGSAYIKGSVLFRFIKKLMEDLLGCGDEAYVQKHWPAYFDFFMAAMTIYELPPLPKHSRTGKGLSEMTKDELDEIYYDSGYFLKMMELAIDYHEGLEKTDGPGRKYVGPARVNLFKNLRAEMKEETHGIITEADVSGKDPRD